MNEFGASRFFKGCFLAQQSLNYKQDGSAFNFQSGREIQTGNRPVALEICVVAAMARNRVIGLKGDMPWRIPKDFRFFQNITMHKPVIMGRKTFESLRKPLIGRECIVVTHKTDAEFPNAKVAHSLEEALAIGKQIAQAQGVSQIMVIGGGEIYAQAVNIVDRLYLTEIEAVCTGDTYFPEFDQTQWREVRREPFPDDPRASYPAVLVELERKS